MAARQAALPPQRPSRLKSPQRSPAARGPHLLPGRNSLIPVNTRGWLSRFMQRVRPAGPHLRLIPRCLPDRRAQGCDHSPQNAPHHKPADDQPVVARLRQFHQQGFLPPPPPASSKENHRKAHQNPDHRPGNKPDGHGEQKIRPFAFQPPKPPNPDGSSAAGNGWPVCRW